MEKDLIIVNHKLKMTKLLWSSDLFNFVLRQCDFYPQDSFQYVLQLKFIHKNQIHFKIVRDTVENHTHKLDSFNHDIRVHIHKQFVDSFRIWNINKVVRL